MPAKQPKRGRLWLAEGSLMRRRAERPRHVWSYDFVFDRTAEGRPLRILAIVDEYTRECLSLDVARRLRSDDVLARLAQLFVERGPPTYLRSTSWMLTSSSTRPATARQPTRSRRGRKRPAYRSCREPCIAGDGLGVYGGVRGRRMCPSMIVMHRGIPSFRRIPRKT